MKMSVRAVGADASARPPTRSMRKQPTAMRGRAGTCPRRPLPPPERPDLRTVPRNLYRHCREEAMPLPSVRLSAARCAEGAKRNGSFDSLRSLRMTYRYILPFVRQLNYRTGAAGTCPRPTVHRRGEFAPNGVHRRGGQADRRGRRPLPRSAESHVSKTVFCRWCACGIKNKQKGEKLCAKPTKRASPSSSS